MIFYFSSSIWGQSKIAIETKGPGELLSLIENIESIETLSVKGFLNEADFKVMNNMVQISKLRYIDIYNCSITVEPSIDNNKIPNSAFENCKKLMSIKLPSSTVYIGDFAFMGCENLNEIDFPNSLIGIGARSFHYCYSLKEIILPNSVKQIGNSFMECKNLEKVVLSDNLSYIGNGAFDGCKLTNIVLPESLEDIGIYCFSGCNLKYVYSKKKQPIDAKYAFDHSIDENSVLYVPKGSIESYKWSVEGWNNFKHIYEYNEANVSNEKINTNHMKFTTTPNGISIQCNNPTDIMIYDIQGKIEYNKKKITNGFIYLPKGIHILKSSDQSIKISI